MKFLHALLISLTLASASYAAPIEPLPQEDVLTYIENVTRWQKDASELDASTSNTRELLLQDNVERTSVNVLRNVFKFAKLEAVLTQSDKPQDAVASTSDTPTTAERLHQRSAETDALVEELQHQMKRATGAQRQELSDRLRLALAKQQLFSNVMKNVSAANSSNAFEAQLIKLEQSIPELATSVKSPDAKPADATAPATAAIITPKASNSVLTLASNLYDILRKQRDLRSFQDETEQLQEDSRNMIKPLSSALNAITGAKNPKETIDEQLTTFNHIGAIMMPLGEANFGIAATKATLDDWQRLLDQRFKETLRRFLVKFAVLAITVAIPLILGECARRAIKNYIRDPKRQRMANSARRIAVSIAVVFILLFNFISDFSSFATFAGFMTAGLAVALQSVLLSLVAHFFFYGRYGVRAGDRVNVAGVTGDILSIGMTRFFMRELKKNEAGELVATGKTVAFPNSILFQPAAFYKYVGD